MPAQIVQGTEIVTLINLFKVDPERQAEAAAVLIAATDEHIRSKRGSSAPTFTRPRTALAS